MLLNEHLTKLPSTFQVKQLKHELIQILVVFLINTISTHFHDTTISISCLSTKSEEEKDSVSNERTRQDEFDCNSLTH